jgi:hypothetical protein
MFGWLLVGIFAVPALGPLLLEGVREVVHAVWMRRHDDPPVVQPVPLVASERPAPVEVEGWAGVVVDGELG